MPELQQYGVAMLAIDQTFQTQVTEVTKNTESGDQEVFTLANGFAGYSPGAGSVKISIKYVLPEDLRAEFNFDLAIFERKFHNIQLTFGSLDYIGQGKFSTGSFTQGVNAIGEGTAEFSGTFGPMK